MSLIDRANDLPDYVLQFKQGQGKPFIFYFDVFKKGQEEYDNIEGEPTEKQTKKYESLVNDFTERLIKVEKKAEEMKEYADQIISSVQTFESIKNDPKCATYMEESKDFARRYHALEKKVEPYKVQDGKLTAKSVGKVDVGIVNPEKLVEIYKKMQEKDPKTSKKKKSPNGVNRAQIEKIISSIPTVEIQSNQDLSNMIDKVQSILANSEGEEELPDLIKDIKKFVPKNSNVCSECEIEVQKLYGDFCQKCMTMHVKINRDDIISRCSIFEDQKNSRDFKATFENQEDHKKFIVEIEKLRDEHDEAYVLLENAKSDKLKHYENYMKAFEAIDSILPKNMKKKSKKFKVPEIDSEEEEILEDSGGDSEYESDSSSSHSLRKPSKKRERDLLFDILDTFQDAHPELKRLASVDPSKIAEEFEKSKNQIKKYTVNLYSKHDGKLMPIKLEGNIYTSKDKAEVEGKNLYAIFNGAYDYKIEEI